MAPQTPMFTSQGDEDGVVICHKEYLGDIISSSTAGAFKIDTWNINPADHNTFPWLSTLVGANFQQFKFESLIFHFKSTSADALNSTNTALGSVFSCINYDATDEDFESRYEIENSDWSKSCKPSDDILIPVECAPRFTAMNGMLYLANGVMPAGVDPKMYYLGKLSLASQGLQGTSVNIGSLFVTYRVRLYKPVMSRPLSQALFYSQLRSGVSANVRLGNADITNSGNADNIGITLSANDITISHKRLMPGQRFILNYVYYRDGSSSATLGAPAIVVSSGLDYSTIFTTSSTSEYGNYNVTNPSASAAAMIHMGNLFCFTVNSNTVDQTITFSSGTYSGSYNCLIALYQINGLTLSRIGILE